MFDTVELRDHCRKAAGDKIEFASDAELCAAIVDVVAARRGLDAFEAHVLAELDTRGVCERDYGMTTGRWVAWRTNEAPGPCRSRVNVANMLRQHFAHVDAAVVAGGIGWIHAKTLCDAANPRNIDGLAELQEALVELAKQATFERYRQEIRGLAEQLDADGGHEPDINRNHLRLTPLGDGYTDVRGGLYGDLALTCSHAIEQETDRLYRQYKADRKHCPDLEIPSRPTLRAMALAELCRKALARDIGDTTPRRVEAVIIIDPDHDIDDNDDTDDCDSTEGCIGPDHGESTGNDDDSAGCSHPANRAARRVMRRIARRHRRQIRYTTLNGDPVSIDAVNLLLHDPVWQLLQLSPDGIPLNLGLTTRWATPHQRKALAVRDGGCVFPGCGTPVAWCDAHHVIWWENGGPTDIANLALLCRHHHGVTHRNGWTMTTTPDQWFTWTTPAGNTIHSQRHGQQQTARAGP